MRASARLVAIVIVLLTPCLARAEDAGAFFRGKTITLDIGYEAGGAYDLYARMIARHLGKHVPGAPNVVPANMPGASSMALGNHLARLAPRDGTVIGAVNSALVFDPLFSGDRSKARFTGPDLTPIGNALSAAAVLFSWKTTGVKTIEDLREKGLLIGAMTRTGDTYVLPSALKKLIGLDKLRIVTGYAGTREAVIALERGEIAGRVWDVEGLRSTRPQWLENGDVNLIVAIAPRRTPDLPADLPLARDLLANDDDRLVLDTISLTTLMARPFFAPPDVPADRVAILRRAFMDTMADPDYLADMRTARASVTPMSGEEMETFIRAAYALPAPLVKRVRDLLNE